MIYARNFKEDFGTPKTRFVSIQNTVFSRLKLMKNNQEFKVIISWTLSVTVHWVTLSTSVARQSLSHLQLRSVRTYFLMHKNLLR